MRHIHSAILCALTLAASWEVPEVLDLPDPSHTVVESYADGWAWSVPLSASRRFVASWESVPHFDLAGLYTDARLAKELLDWEPTYTDVKSIVETAWRWHKSHPNGYRS